MREMRSFFTSGLSSGLGSGFDFGRMASFSRPPPDPTATTLPAMSRTRPTVWLVTPITETPMLATPNPKGAHHFQSTARMFGRLGPRPA